MLKILSWSKNPEAQLLHYNKYLLGLAPGCIKKTIWPTMGSRPILRWEVEKQHWFWNDYLWASNSRFQSFLSHLTKSNGWYRSIVRMGNAMFYFQLPVIVLKIKQTRSTLNFLILAKLQSKYEQWASMQIFLPCEGFLEWTEANLDGLLHTPTVFPFITYCPVIIVLFLCPPLLNVY